MKDDEFTQKLAKVEAIIDRLNQGGVTLEEGDDLRQRAIDLLDKLEASLDQGKGETVVVKMDSGGVVEEELGL